MTTLKLIPRATKTEGGRWRPEVLIAHESGDQSVWGAASVASHDTALESARRLVASALAEAPIEMELSRPVWK
jgi:hypothetical protein